MVFTNFKEKLCRSVFLHEEVTLPEGFILGFSKTEPNKDGSNITEPSEGCGYSRVPLANLKMGNNIVFNGADIEYAKATSSWGRLTWCVLYDQDGNALSAQELEKPIVVDVDETLMLKTGDVKLWFGESMVIA